MKALIVVGLLGLAALAQAETITDANATYNATLSTTGNNQIGPSGVVGPFTAQVGGPGFCVGPPVACGSGSGLSGSVSWSDLPNGDDQLTVSFAGSTDGAGPGTFDILLSGFDSIDGIPITNVTETSGSSFLGGFGSFGLGPGGFTNDTIDLEGSTSNDYNGLGGVAFTFDVANGTPEPSTILLAIGGLAGVVIAGRRRARN